MGGLKKNGVSEKKQDVRILVLLPEGDENIKNVEKDWNEGFADRYKDIAGVDFCKVTKVGENGDGTRLKIAESCKVADKDKKPGGTLDAKEIKGSGYCLGIAYGDWLTDWICNNRDLTPPPKNDAPELHKALTSNLKNPETSTPKGGLRVTLQEGNLDGYSENNNDDHTQKALLKETVLKFILITTKSVSDVKEPHLKAYPGEELVGMLLAQLMDRAAERGELKNGEENYEWRAFFYKDKNAQGSNACLEAFKENAKDFCQETEERAISFYQDGESIYFDSKDGKSIYFASKEGDEIKVDEKFNGEFDAVKLFCVYAASAPDADAYNTVVKAIDSLQSNGKKKILVTDACWDVPEECKNLQIAQLCGTQSQKNGELLVGQKLFSWLIPVLLELVLKTVKWSRGLKVSRPKQEECIADYITAIGPLMAVQGTTFSFIESEMFIPFSFSYRNWDDTGKVLKPYEPMEEMRSVEEAHEAVAVAMSGIEAAADRFKNKRTQARPEELIGATAEFAEEFETNILGPCFAAQKVFFVDDKHDGVRQDRWKLPFEMPKNCVDEVARHSRVIQIAYIRWNIENTEAVQLYRVREADSKGKVVVSVTDSLLKRLRGEDEDGFSSETEIFCSRSKQRADTKLKKKSDERWDLDKDRILNGLVTANLNKSGCRYQYNYLYYIPAYNWDRSGNMPAVAFFSDVKFCDFELSALKMVVTRFYSALYTEDRVRKIKTYSIRSAIGAIMSRNGSHNIGSHVLASLSHHVGTCPDDRVMYQYIQHRMDYIAMATTDFPNWRQPMRLVGDLMKTFLSQRHLLDGIAKSEGLVAYQFQNVALPGEQPNTIRLHARRVSRKNGTDELTERLGINPEHGTEKDSEYYYLKYDLDALDAEESIEFVDYQNQGSSSGMSGDLRYSKDVDVAIAGGEVGQHALFTIIENVLRNAAKHSWAKLPDEDKTNLKKSLNVYLDFRERLDEGGVECIVWSDVPVVELGKLIAGKGGLVEKASQKFVKTDGQLRRGSLGLAEMRIAAGFLQGADIRQIGGQDGAKKCLDLICPVDVVWKTDPIKHCLGFRFTIPEPRELLVLTSECLIRDGNNDRDAEQQSDVLKGLRRQGVWVKSWEEFCKDKDGAFSFVVLDGGIAGKLTSNPSENEGRLALKHLPFRTIVEGESSKWKEHFGRDVASVAEADGIVDEIKKAVQAETKDDANGVAENLLKRVYKIWIDTLKKDRKDKVQQNEPLSVVVDVNGAESGAGRGLVDDFDIVYYALENMLDSAINSFLDVANGLSKDDRDAFDHLMSLKERPVWKKKENTVKEVIVWHVDYWQDVNDDDLLGRLTSIDSDYNLKSTPVLTKFIKFFEEVVLAQTKAILSGYKERIATLPPSFGVGDTSGFCAKFDRTWPDVATIYFSGEDTERFKHGNSCLAFCRHLEFDTRGDEHDKFKDMLYAEPLSGSQSYLNALIAFRNRASQYKEKTDLSTNDIRLMTKMLECGLQRVLIIDERMKKFKAEHADIALTFDHIGVGIMDDTDEDVKNLFKYYQNGNKDNVLEGYEIVIIHMGIIDKLLPEHEKSEAVGRFVADLQKKSHYVVVTTGRGAPPNLPPDACVLPFSVVESAMFSRYPEKMTLVDNVMNVLPGKGVAQ